MEAFVERELEAAEHHDGGLEAAAQAAAREQGSGHRQDEEHHQQDARARQCTPGGGVGRGSRKQAGEGTEQAPAGPLPQADRSAHGLKVPAPRTVPPHPSPPRSRPPAGGGIARYTEESGS
ncbi:hypothetical protein GCM10020229_34940 [Kitasatospora albolonga]